MPPSFVISIEFSQKRPCLNELILSRGVKSLSYELVNRGKKRSGIFIRSGNHDLFFGDEPAAEEMLTIIECGGLAGRGGADGIRKADDGAVPFGRHAADQKLLF